MAARFQQRRLWEEDAGQGAASDEDRPDPLAAAWEKRVLLGLAAEWAQARALLPAAVRAGLKPPLFALDEARRRLGAWRPQRREITLSRHLVSSARWDDIREVLLHEMAHQVAYEALGAGHEPDHGPGFRRACGWLRIDAAASGAHRPLHERLREGERLDESDRIVLRIQKLMALAQSSHPHEAHAAMGKAHELIARHNVALIDGGVRQDYVSIFVGEPRLRHGRQAYHLAHLLQDFYFVTGMWVQAWVLERARMGRVLEISGSRKNVLMAEYTYHAVCRYIETSWQAYRRPRNLGGRQKTDFAVGIIHGFRSTLEQAVAARSAQESLPVCAGDPALSRYVARRYPHVRRVSRRPATADLQVLADGTAKGRQLVIAKGIERKDGFRKRLLEK